MIPQSPSQGAAVERAFFGTRDGGILVGYGPFTKQAIPPESGVAFYRNDFSLSEPTPWWVPDRVAEFEGGDAISTPEIHWTTPEPADFAEVFREVSVAIEQGVIQKSVPVVTERGNLKAGHVEGILSRFDDLAPALRPYGWIGDEEGFLGVTPEVLFRFFDGRIDTMALAGTARSDEADIFAVDDKEIREHEFVAQTLIEKLSSLGMVRRKERDILNLGQLIHFRTLIEVELYKHEEIGKLIAHLHPTPALGPLPRTGETLSQLHFWRERLDCPREFGAPFGLLQDGDFEALVAIRMLGWKGDEFQLPSGCGVIAESRLVNEWRELGLKRDSVRRLLLG
ncbi:MAG: chorismate-binding protein [Akkermansiaceae bacterium]